VLAPANVATTQPAQVNATLNNSTTGNISSLSAAGSGANPSVPPNTASSNPAIANSATLLTGALAALTTTAGGNGLNSLAPGVSLVPPPTSTVPAQSPPVLSAVFSGLAVSPLAYAIPTAVGPGVAAFSLVTFVAPQPPTLQATGLFAVGGSGGTPVAPGLGENPPASPNAGPSPGAVPPQDQRQLQAPPQQSQSPGGDQGGGSGGGQEQEQPPPSTPPSAVEPPAAPDALDALFVDLGRSRSPAASAEHSPAKTLRQVGSMVGATTALGLVGTAAPPPRRWRRGRRPE
jgi:hypothetical protein